MKNGQNSSPVKISKSSGSLDQDVLKEVISNMGVLLWDILLSCNIHLDIVGSQNMFKHSAFENFDHLNCKCHNIGVIGINNKGNSIMICK